jgi:hypothetical protein
MPSPRFELALKLLDSTQWRLFERLASEFLAVEYPDLRTMASSNGDKGRDGECFTLDAEPKIAFQYSVAVDWRSKIAQTVKRISETLPGVAQLIYVTNQTIGANADDIRIALREIGLSLDLRDSSWFLERELTHAQRQTAAEELAAAIVDPTVKQRAVLQSAVQLTGEDGRIALVHLALERADGATDKSLTKRSFEALVLAALDDTHADKRLSLAGIQSKVKTFVPAGAPGQVEALVVSALTRLSAKNGPVKLRRNPDEYHMSFEQNTRLNEQTATYLLEQRAVEQDIDEALARLTIAEEIAGEERAIACLGIRSLLEIVSFRLGESFATAVQTGEPFHLDPAEILSIVDEGNVHLPFDNPHATEVIMEVLAQTSELTTQHLKRIADAYTLFAFLRQTPDIQKVIVQVFSQGDIWLDTTAILPLIAESMIDEAGERYYTQLLGSAVDAGLKLFLTDGVLEEVERHINRCISFSASSNWQGRTPFIYSAYILSGRPAVDFRSWAETIRGNSRPVDDVRDYLSEEFNIGLRSLTSMADRASVELRGAVQELWREAHDARRTRDEYATDNLTVGRLIDHDVENTVGIIEMRRSAPPSPMGYQAWWLTLDSTAYRLRDYLRDRLGNDAPASPVLSPDFLAQLFRLGPMRQAIEQKRHVQFPMLTDMSRMENIPKELIQLAGEVREQCAGMQERVIRRNVRDALDAARSRQSGVAIASQSAVQSRIAAQRK